MEIQMTTREDGPHPIRQYRLDNGMSQAEFADEIGVHAITVTRWELGTRKMNLKQLSRVSRLTGIPPAELRPDLAQLFA
jgi:transcriptional regulator with XRE-family HTH domain